MARSFPRNAGPASCRCCRRAPPAFNSEKDLQRLAALRGTTRPAFRQGRSQHHAGRTRCAGRHLARGGACLLATPLLVIVGDEDDHSIQPGVFLKRTVPRSGLAMFQKSGHTLNLEEPEMFNRNMAEFLAQVEAGRWGPRDPRADPRQIMHTE